MAIVVRSNTPFASIMKGYIPGAKYVYVNPTTRQTSPTVQTIGQSVSAGRVSSHTSPIAGTEVIPSSSPSITPTAGTPSRSAVEGAGKQGGSSVLYSFMEPWDKFFEQIGGAVENINSLLSLVVPGTSAAVGSVGGSGGGGASEESWLTSWLTGAGAQSDDSFFKEIQNLMGNLPAAQGAQEDTFMADIQGLLGSLPSGQFSQEDDFLKDITSLLPAQTSQVAESGSFYDEISALMASMPVVDLSQPSTNEYYDYYYQYAAEDWAGSFIYDYL